jgi:hypothetical protein
MKAAWAAGLALAAVAACACLLLAGSAPESELVQRVVYQQRARQPRAAYEALPVATAVPLQRAQPRQAAARRRTQHVLRAGGADPNAPKQVNAPRVPPKTGIVGLLSPAY